MHPSFYKGKDTGLSFHNIHRDIYEQRIFNFCIANNVKMTGICRGFQFLNVFAGGRMYQHITNHGICGTHLAYFDTTGDSLPVTSTHHQLVKLPGNAIPIAWADPKLSDVYMDADCEEHINIKDREIEAAIFPTHNIFGVQFHPEFMDADEPGRIYYELLINRFLKYDMQKFTMICLKEISNNSIKDLTRGY